MEKELYLTFGLPCSGKTEYAVKSKGFWSEDKKDGINFKRVIFNDIQQQIPIIIGDSCGFNREEMLDIIDTATINGYNVIIYFIDTPIDVCLSRTTSPEVIKKIYELEIKKLGTWFYYKSIGYVNCIRVPYFTREYLFFDMDGVLAPQLQLPKSNGEIDFVNSNYFENLPVVKSVQSKIMDYDSNKLFILSATPNSVVLNEKKIWLENHYPFIPKEHIFFVNQGLHKAQMFRDLSEYLNIDPKKMCLIDDTMSIVEEVKFKYKMDAIHISHFLIDYKNN